MICKECGNNIKKMNTIFKAYDQTACSNHCTRIITNKILIIDPKLAYPGIWSNYKTLYECELKKKDENKDENKDEKKDNGTKLRFKEPIKINQNTTITKTKSHSSFNDFKNDNDSKDSKDSKFTLYSPIENYYNSYYIKYFTDTLNWLKNNLYFSIQLKYNLDKNIFLVDEHYHYFV
jgi:hypothetical protein